MPGSPNLSQEFTPKIPLTKRLSKRYKEKTRIKNSPFSPFHSPHLKQNKTKLGSEILASVCQIGVFLCRLSTVKETYGHSGSFDEQNSAM